MPQRHNWQVKYLDKLLDVALLPVIRLLYVIDQVTNVSAVFLPLYYQRGLDQLALTRFTISLSAVALWLSLDISPSGYTGCPDLNTAAKYLTDF